MCWYVCMGLRYKSPGALYGIVTGQYNTNTGPVLYNVAQDVRRMPGKNIPPRPSRFTRSRKIFEITIS